MTYTPHRDPRFEYVHEAIEFIEETQCRVCVFRRTDDDDYPMCFPVSGDFYLEEPMDYITDLEDQGLVCQKFKVGNPTPTEVEGQGELF